MSRFKLHLLIACAVPALAWAPGAAAQSADPHAGHTMPAPAPAPTPKPTPKPTPTPGPVSGPGDPHAGHVMPAEPAPASDPHAGHAMPPPEPEPDVADPHAGHEMPATNAVQDPHAGHAMGATTPGVAAGTDLPAGTGSPPPVPTDYAADAVYGNSAMAMGRHHLVQYHGGQNVFMAILNIAEVKIRDGRDGFAWDGEAWYGGDINRLVVKTEGEGDFGGGGVETAEVQALYSRAIGPYFDLQGGVRYDFRPDPSRVYATLGFEGLAPGFFDVEGALFLSNKGELMARLEGYYDQRITQRLILQPRAELNFAAQSSEEIGVGKGLVDAELGLRLRYDIAREFAPYIGVQYERTFGETRDFRRDEGESTGGWSFLAGIRMWF